MKRYVIVIVLAFFVITNEKAIAQLQFTKGVNVTNWFQTNSAKEIQFTKFTKKDFVNIKSLGCDVIRLPINLHAMTSGAPEYILDPLFLQFLDEVVEWSEELNIHLILDNHTFDPSVNTSPDIGIILVKVWKQMALHYKDRSNLIYFEVLNEPHGISDTQWGQIQQNVINAIREVNQKHWIVVGAANWNSFHNLKNLPNYSDNKLIYTFHFYEPFVFTHQGASWVEPSMVPLAGVPFPYSSSTMPVCPQSLKGSWIENSLNNYHSEGNVEKIKQLIDIAAEFKIQKNVPIFCGEFGVYIPNSNNSDRVYWYEVVRKYMEEKGIPWTIWDYTGGFGLFKEHGNDMFEHDLNVSLVESLGFKVPEQTDFILKPETDGFIIYSDFVGEKIIGGTYQTDLNFYSTTQPNNDDYCISWTEGPQYSSISFDFKPNKDLSKLVEEGYAIDLLIRGNSAGSKLDIRFLDTKTADPDDKPWRMRYTLDETKTSWNEKWHHIRIPLNQFSEQGSWYNNSWLNPVGQFDWAAIDKLEIVAEHHAIQGKTFWFDNIFINNQDTAKVLNQNPIVVSLTKEAESLNLKLYPNPTKTHLNITFNLMQMSNVEVEIYNITGQKIRTLINEIINPGAYTYFWDGKDNFGNEVNGIFFCKISTSSFSKTYKIMKK